jgi:surface antigen
MSRLGKRLVGTALLASMTVPLSAANAQSYWQCVPFARMVSGIDLFGAAASWWRQAVGRYDQGSLPRAGSVLVFKAISSMRSGHVATVSKVVSDRVIEVTHANWSIIDGRRGRIERNVRVIDVSPANDWSQVRVWWAPMQDLGTRSYPTYGFIYSTPAPLTNLTAAPVMASVTAKSAAPTLLARLPGSQPAIPLAAAPSSLLALRAPGPAVPVRLVTVSPPPPAQPVSKPLLKATSTAAAPAAADRREAILPQAAPSAPIKALLVLSPPTAPKLALN